MRSSGLLSVTLLAIALAILRDTAEFHLMVDFHGANKPAGESRTWPNEMTREAVLGLERRSMPSWAEHNTTLPFTRFLAGAADYTPVIFSARRGETSWTHQIATAVVFTSPLLVFGANPTSLLENPAVDVIRSLPAAWDETIVLPGSAIGELAAYARRSGDTWFVGVLNGAKARSIRLDLRFLGAGPYRATLVRDDPDNPAAEQIEQVSVTRQHPLTAALRPAGGFVGRFVPQGAARGTVPR